MSDLWFAEYNEEYSGREPAFYSPEEVGICNSLEDKYFSISQEFQRIIKTGDSFRAFADDSLQSPANSWTKLVLMVWGIENPAIMAKFPSLKRMVKENPSILSLFISRLGPKSFIKAHCGETNGTYRVHLGLKVPEETKERAGIRVNNENRFWKEGKAFAFLDAHRHEAWNEADEDRYVLILDIIRPEFKHYRNRLCVRILWNQLLFNLFDKMGNDRVMNVIGKIPPLLVYPGLIVFLPLKWLQSKLTLVVI